MTGFAKKASGGLTIVIVVVLFVALTVLFNALFRSARLDLTENRQYTLSQGTVEVLKSIDEPIQLYFFFSEQSSQQLPQFRTYAQRVRELLQEMAQRAGGKLNLELIDPQPFSEEEDQATSLGLQAVPLGNTGQTLIFGLAGRNAVGAQSLIPFFDPSKETFLEYDVAKLIQSLVKVEKSVIGVISSLPLAGGFDPVTRQMSDPWVVYQQMGELFEMRPLGTDVSMITEDIKVLLVVHPKDLSESTQYAIDQFVLRGGRAVVYVDPSASMDRSGDDPSNPMAAAFANRSSDLPKLFQAWGVKYDPSQVVADRRAGLLVTQDPQRGPVRHPLILGLTRENMDQQDIVSAELESINIDTGGRFELSEAGKSAGIQFEPLLFSSTDATLVSADRVRFLPDPTELYRDFAATGERYPIAVRVRGNFKSAFPERANETGHIAESREPGNLILVADTDILSNRTWVQVQPFFGQQVFNAFANNGEFNVNAVDNLSGSSALISIRGRGTTQRPFARVEDLRRQAEQRFRDTEQRLQDELRQTEQRLTELQRAKGDQQSALILSPEQQAEIKRFREQKVQIRKQLREVRRNLDQDIERLGTTIKLINIALVPLIVVVIAILFHMRRAQRRRQVALAAGG